DLGLHLHGRRCRSEQVGTPMDEGGPVSSGRQSLGRHRGQDGGAGWSWPSRRGWGDHGHTGESQDEGESCPPVPGPKCHAAPLRRRQPLYCLAPSGSVGFGGVPGNWDLWCSLECTPACQAGGGEFKSRQVRGRIAQVVERAPEKCEVVGSMPTPTTAEPQAL